MLIRKVSVTDVDFRSSHFGFRNVAYPLFMETEDTETLICQNDMIMLGSNFFTTVNVVCSLMETLDK